MSPREESEDYYNGNSNGRDYSRNSSHRSERDYHRSSRRDYRRSDHHHYEDNYESRHHGHSSRSYYDNGGGYSSSGRSRRHSPDHSSSSYRSSHQPRRSKYQLATAADEYYNLNSTTYAANAGEIMAGVLPLSQWPRKLKNWDVAPPGYENMSAAQVKASGLFPLACQTIKNFEFAPVMGQGGFSGLAQNNPAAQSANAVKQARRIYIGNLPGDCTNEEIQEFFSKLLEDANGEQGPGRPCLSCQIQSDQTYAFVEFRTPNEATQSIQYDGIQFKGSNLRIRRPREYVPQSNLEAMTNLGLDSDNKLFIGNLPTYLTDDQIKELLMSVGGELKSFSLAKDQSGISKGYAFCEYLDTLVTDNVITSMNGFQLGDNSLVFERASSARARQALSSDDSNSKGSLMTLLASTDIKTHPVLVLINLLTPADLKSDESHFTDLVQDVLTECERYGNIKSHWAPRIIPGKNYRGLGKIFVEYDTEAQCRGAAESLHGRRFNDRVVVTGYYPKDDYDNIIQSANNGNVSEKQVANGDGHE